MSGDTPPDTSPTPESEAREEAEWALITAHTLQGRGDVEGAAMWFRRAVEHLMDAGDDDRALEVARLAADLRTQPPPAPSAPAPVAVAPIPVAPPIPAAPPVPVAPAVADEPASEGPESLPSIIVAPPSEPPPAPVVQSAIPAPAAPAAPAVPSAPPQPFQPAPSIRPAQPVHVPAPVATQPPPAAVLAPVAPIPQNPVPAVSVPPPSAPSVAPAPVAPPASAPPPAAPKPARKLFTYAPERASQAELLAVQLPALPVFGDMPVEAVRAISRQVSLIRFSPGETMIDGESFDGPMLVLTEGTARVSAAHQKSALDTASAGDIVGEISALHGGMQVTTVTAETPVSAVAFPPSLVRALAREYTGFRTMLEEVISDRAFACLPGHAALLRALGPTARESAYALFEPVKMREGDALFSEGNAPSAVWLIAAGEIELYGGMVPPRSLERAQAGTALCVGSVLSNEPCGVSARALRDVLVARIGAATFRGLAAQYPEIAAALRDVGLVGHGIAC